jgi:hypothetical protein
MRDAPKPALAPNKPPQKRARAKRRLARPPHLWPRPIDPKEAAKLAKLSPYRDGEEQSLVASAEAKVPAKLPFRFLYEHPAFFRPDLLMCERSEVYGCTLESHLRSLAKVLIFLSLSELFFVPAFGFAFGLAIILLAAPVLLLSMPHPYFYLIFMAEWLDDHGRPDAALRWYDQFAKRVRGSRQEAPFRLLRLSCLWRNGRTIEALREAEILFGYATDRKSEIEKETLVTPPSAHEQQLAFDLAQLAFARVLWLRLDLGACDDVELRLATSHVVEESADPLVSAVYFEIRMRIAFERGKAPSAQDLEKAHQFFSDCLKNHLDLTPLTVLMALLIWAYLKLGSVEKAIELHNLYRAHGCPLTLENRLPALMQAIPDRILAPVDAETELEQEGASRA